MLFLKICTFKGALIGLKKTSMVATYIRDANCQICMDTYPERIGEGCEKCMSMRTETVKILDFVKDLFGAKAIIEFQDGTLQMVPITKLKLSGY